jgi:L-ascorbate metabolism protein UlaG (beta-lactamase superfamily)
MTVLLGARPLSAAPPTLTARFIGNMAFAITDGRTTLFTDFPYEPGAFGYMTYDFASVPKPATAGDALCLITHGHRDHFDPELFSKMPAGTKIIAPPTLAATLPADRVLPFSGRIAYRDITVEPVRTRHGDIEHFSYLVTWHGRRLYFTGDTDRYDDLVARHGLDDAFVSPWLLAAIVKHGKSIDARRVIVYHHKPDETVARLPSAFVTVPKQGETIALD